MEFKKNASDINSNTDWNGMDARLLIYDPNTSEYTSGRNIYVNLASGNWKWKGGLIFENYDPSKCNFTLTHSYDKMIEPGHTMTTSEFFEAIRNPQ